MNCNNTWENKASNIQRLRELLGLKQSECAELFGVSLRSWQKREARTEDQKLRVKMSNAEFQYLLLLANQHPDYILVKRESDCEQT